MRRGRTILICSCCGPSRGGKTTSSGLKLWRTLVRRKRCGALATRIIRQHGCACDLPTTAEQRGQDTQLGNWCTDRSEGTPNSPLR